MKKCTVCNELYPNSKRKCDICKVDLPKKKDVVLPKRKQKAEAKPDKQSIKKVCFDDLTFQNDARKEKRYNHITSAHHNHLMKTTMMDPVCVNPNSAENSATVLRKIGKDAGVKRYGGTERLWLTVCCDGLPFGIILQIIQNYLICDSCQERIIGTEAFKSHVKAQHPTWSSPTFTHEYNWVDLKTGNGHVEMNLLKAFVGLNCTKDLVQLLGFKSETALISAQKCYDKHKTWQIINIFFFGTLQKLVLVYM